LRSIQQQAAIRKSDHEYTCTNYSDLEQVFSPYIVNLGTSSGARGSIAKGVETETRWVPESIDLGLGDNWPRMAGTDETDHFEDAGIVPEVANARNAVVDN
jgi:hypothetical protein